MRHLSLLQRVTGTLAILLAGAGFQPASAESQPSYLGQEPPGLIPEVFAPGIVSTDNLEIAGVFAPDMTAFYFTRQFAGETSKSYVMRYENGEWQQPALFAEPQPSISSDFHRHGFISPDGNRMHIGGNYRERTSSGWSDPVSLGSPIEEYPVMRLTTSAEGTYVFDESTETGTIRYSRLVNGVREEPQPFGENINTGRWTAHPFIAADESYLIWDSERDGGYGGVDLYISFRQEDGSWGPAINMGEEINTEHTNMRGRVSPDGRYFFFDTINLSDEGFEESEANIFWVDAQIIENLRPGR